MSSFRFRLEPVLRLRRVERDQRRARLAEALEAEQLLQARMDELQAARQGLQDGTRQALQAGTVDVDRVLEQQRYELVLEGQLLVLLQQQQQLRDESHRRRQELLEADRQVRVLEKLRERQSAEHQQQVLAAEVRELDEVALRRSRTREIPAP